MIAKYKSLIVAVAIIAFFAGLALTTMRTTTLPAGSTGGGMQMNGGSTMSPQQMNAMRQAKKRPKGGG